MSRPVDLEKVKQAWQLRRQSQQQKDIAEALDISLRHVQNYLSVDWLSQRALRVLTKGRAEEANKQLKLLWDLGEAVEGGGLEESKEHLEAQADPDEPAEHEQSSICRAPEHWPDVAQLETWGVPKYEAPGLLSAWRRAHREETHQLCAFWGELVENVQAGTPFLDAYDLIIASWLADRWGYKLPKVIVELYRLYRPWEEKVHRKVYMEEVRVAVSENKDDWVKLGGTIPYENSMLFEMLPPRFLYGLSHLKKER